MLVDEVDVMLNPKILGNLYRPIAKIKDENIFSIMEKIWLTRHEGIKFTTL